MITTKIHKSRKAVRCAACGRVVVPWTEYLLTIEIPLEVTICKEHYLTQRFNAIRAEIDSIDMNVIPARNVIAQLGLREGITAVIEDCKPLRKSIVYRPAA